MCAQVQRQPTQAQPQQQHCCTLQHCSGWDAVKADTVSAAPSITSTPWYSTGTVVDRQQAVQCSDKRGMSNTDRKDQHKQPQLLCVQPAVQPAMCCYVVRVAARLCAPDPRPRSPHLCAGGAQLLTMF
jgi:hypothetical protein